MSKEQDIQGSYPLPKGWKRVPLGNLCQAKERTDPRRWRDRKQFRYVDISGIDGVTGSLTETRDILCSEAPSRARVSVRGSDVLVSTVRPNLRATALVPKSLDGEVASTGFCVLRAKQEVLPGYLYYLTRWPVFTSFLVARCTGASYPAATDRVVLSFSVPFPPLPEQRRIVDLLQRADSLRRLRRQADDLTRQVVPALFHEMFGDLEANPKAWVVVTLGSVLDAIEFGVSAALSKNAEWRPGRIAVVRIANLKGDGTLDLSDLRYLDVPAKKRTQLLLKRGDLLFNWRNSPKWIGKTVIFNGTEECIFASFLYRLVLKTDRVCREYLWFVLNELRRRGFFEAKCRQAVSQANFGRDELSNVGIPLPPLAQQEAFSRRVEEARDLQALQRDGRKSVEGAFQSILCRAFRGELSGSSLGAEPSE